MILSICSNPEILEILAIVKIIMTIIFILVPIVLLFSLIFKFIGAALKSDNDAIATIKKRAVPSIIAAVLVFVVPTVVNLIVTITFPNSEYTECVNNTNSKSIDNLYYEAAVKSVEKVKKTLLKVDYYKAESRIKKVKSDKKEELSNDLLSLKEYVDIMSEIKSAGSQRNRKKLKELQEEIDIIDKEDIKLVLSTQIEKYMELLLVYDPILPDSSEEIVKQEETDTLKIYITKKDKYYLTRIWALNPYEQLNKRNANPYGSKLERPSELLKKEVSEKNLDNQLILGFNASGFYLKDSNGNGYDTNCVDHNPKVNRTSVGTIVITNGEVIRNEYNKGDLLTWFITGVTEDNQMVVFEDKKIKETNPTEKKAWADSVINSGIRNTYTFAAPIIMDGQKTNYNSSNSRMPGGNETPKGLQLFCQINDNNFVLFTSGYETRNKGINLFLNLGCKTAVNLDGGGSIALIFKSSNSSQIDTIVGNGRSLPEVGYFSE